MSRQDARLPRSAVSTGRSAGFTLIEILIVVIILGIVAGIVIPQFSNASLVARENTLKEDLRYMRTQIMAFKLQHRDIVPGYPGGNAGGTPTAADFIQQMTQFSDESFNLSPNQDPLLPYGPYLSSLPRNPINGVAGVWVVNGPLMQSPDAGQPFAWIYNPQLQKFIVNLPGADADGKPYADY
jgi:prepilin-type N-terminal cleavage/methylation domain-containing protein